MNKNNFERLKKSVTEAGKIMRGEIQPSREFVYEIDSAESEMPIEIWAVCIETDDAESFIPGKIYFVKQLTGGFWARDEEGEATFCPSNFFIPIELPQTLSEKLVNIRQAA